MLRGTDIAGRAPAPPASAPPASAPMQRTGTAGAGFRRRRRGRHPDRARLHPTSIRTFPPRFRWPTHHPANQPAAQRYHRCSPTPPLPGRQYGQQWITGTASNSTFYNSRSLPEQLQPAVQPVPPRAISIFMYPAACCKASASAVNNRDIRVARNNLKVSRLQLQTAGGDDHQRRAEPVLGPGELSTTPCASNEQALDAAQKLYDDNPRSRSRSAPWRVSRSRARRPAFPPPRKSCSSRKTNVAQQEIVLKNALSRNAIGKRLAGRRARRAAGPHRDSQDRRSEGRCRT